MLLVMEIVLGILIIILLNRLIVLLKIGKVWEEIF